MNMSELTNTPDCTPSAPGASVSAPVGPSAAMDPWCLVPLTTGGQVLLGYATQHASTGGLSWVRSTPVVDVDEVAGRARTASGRTYRLGRRIEPADLPAEGEEAWLAYDTLVRCDAADHRTVPPLSTDRHRDSLWLGALKMARHLGIAAPERSLAVVEDFIRRNIDAYQCRAPTPSDAVPPDVAPSGGVPSSDAASLDAGDLTDFASLETDPSPVDAADRRRNGDPAHVAARCLLRNAVEAAGVTIADAGRDGSVCLVLLPDDTWTEIVRDVWGIVVRHGGQYQTSRYEWRRDSRSWAAWAPDERPLPSCHNDIADEFSKAISRGYHCAGFGSDVSWLPADLVQAADYRLTLPAPTVGDVTQIATLLCGHAPTERLSDAQAATLTPRLLRLARRPEQTADAYIAKLRDLLARMSVPAGTAAPDTASPRDAPSLDRLYGMDEAVAFGVALARDLKAYKDGLIAWAAVDRGCLLSGQPGVGKSLYARALATTCCVPLVTGSYSTWLATGHGHQGDLLLAMRRTFESAREQAPCILFLDEVDSFPDRAKVSHRYADWEIQVVNALLAEIDGVEGREGVVIVAACNHPDRLDPALVRSGRLDRHIKIDLPDRAALARILREHLGPDLAGEDLAAAAMAATGASGADCERLVRGARRRARSAGRDMMMADLLAEIGGTDNQSPEDQWLAAVHEAGHAVAASTLWPGSLRVVSLQGPAGTGGLTSADGTASSAYLRPADLRGRLIMLLAGRAAEAAVCGIPSAGAGGADGSDLAGATYLVMTAIVAWGLDEASGLVWRGQPAINEVPDVLAAHPALAARVRDVLDEAYAAACALITARTMAVTAVARALVVRRILDGPEAEDIVRRHPGQVQDQP